MNKVKNQPGSCEGSSSGYHSAASASVDGRAAVSARPDNAVFLSPTDRTQYSQLTTAGIVVLSTGRPSPQGIINRCKLVSCFCVNSQCCVHTFTT